ncbi:MAG: PEP-CTERM sorting domain-containing protein [Phycisphaerae bacterium]
MKKALAVIMVGLLASVSSAATIIEFSDPVDVTFDGQTYVSRTVSLRGTEGEIIDAFTAEFTAGSTTMSQVWEDLGRGPVPDTVFPDAFRTYSDPEETIDTHFLMLADEVLWVEGLPKDESTPTFYDNTQFYAMGCNDLLELSAALAPSKQANVVPLAQIVFCPEATSSDYINYAISIGSGGEESELMSGQLLVPEPATMSLLALGGLAGLIRRRR